MPNHRLSKNISLGKMRSAARRSWCGKPTVSYSMYIIVWFTDPCRGLLDLEWVSEKFEVVPVKAVNASSAVELQLQSLQTLKIWGEGAALCSDCFTTGERASDTNWVRGELGPTASLGKPHKRLESPVPFFLMWNVNWTYFLGVIKETHIVCC